MLFLSFKFRLILLAKFIKVYLGAHIPYEKDMSFHSSCKPIRNENKKSKNVKAKKNPL